MTRIDRDALRKPEIRPPGASPQRGKTGPGLYDAAALALRLAAIALLGTVIWIHLHLWQSGYKHIPIVGPLFLAGALSASVVTSILLARPSRVMGLFALSLDFGILASLIGSINLGLFGFTESLNAPFVTESILIESLAASALALWVVIDRIAQNRHQPIKLTTATEHHNHHPRPERKTAPTRWHETSTSAS